MQNKNIGKFIRNKIILVTGGTGSFGHAAVNRLLKFDPKKIIIFSRDEKKQFDMANLHRGDKRLRFVIGDVRDRARVGYEMQGVNLVFHAAALKHVPHCEFFPYEAIMTNAFGAHNVVLEAVRHNVERVVVLSTDKAVYPINVMGMSKAMMERIMIAAARDQKSKTKLCGTRYGNVMYTRGSVIPLFVDLIKRGAPLTVTDGKMTRFMMSLEDSVDLVLYAMVNGGNGEVYVKKAPAATMGDLAQALAGLFNYKKGIMEMGIRPGEKMHETLMSSEEMFRAEDCGPYYTIRAEAPSQDARHYYFKGVRADGLPAEGYTSANTRRLSVAETTDLLLTLPEIKNELVMHRK
ncbi:MAG: polysaccharide biosynthesis protein [Patescibacteria group bacterium]